MKEVDVNMQNKKDMRTVGLSKERMKKGEAKSEEEGGHGWRDCNVEEEMVKRYSLNVHRG